jgi:hypothetical protein
MKQTLTKIAAIAAIMTVVSSCKKLENKATTPFDFEMSTDLTLPATSDTTGNSQVGDVVVNYNLDSMINAQSSGLANFSSVDKITLSSLTVEFTNPDNANNSANFQTWIASFATNINSDPYGLAYVENNADQYNSSLNMSIYDANKDLKPYFSSNGATDISYFLGAKLRRATTKDLQCHLTVKYHVAWHLK